MKKNNNEPELATFTLLNPDFHTSVSQLTNEQLIDEKQEEQNLSTNSD